MSDLRRIAVSRLAATASKSKHREQNSKGGSRPRGNADDFEEEYDDDLSVISDSDWSVVSGSTVDSYDSESGRTSPSRAKKDADLGVEWREKLGEYIDRISQERKNSSYATREDAMARICKILSLKYAWQTVEERHKDLEDGIMKSLKGGRTEKEILLACRALSLLVITDPENEAWYLNSLPILKNLIYSAEDPGTKAAGLQALGSVIFFSMASGASELRETLEFLLDVIASDGSSIQATDSEDVVAATISCFGFLASKLDDALELSQSSLPVLVDQLESSVLSVRMAAGNVIALLYERYAEDIGNYHLVYESEDDDSDSEDSIVNEVSTKLSASTLSSSSKNSAGDFHDFEEEEPEQNKPMKRPEPRRTPSSRPTLYYDEDELLNVLTQLATSSTKRISKASRRVQHSVFRDVLDTVRTAIGDATAENDADNVESVSYGGIDYGIETTGPRLHISRELKLEGLTLPIESWDAYLRFAHVKRVLSHGLPVHYTKNRVIRIALDPLGSSTYEKVRSTAPNSVAPTPPLSVANDGYISSSSAAARDDEEKSIEKEYLRLVDRKTKQLRQESIQRDRRASSRDRINQELGQWDETEL
ncbi:interferon-related developmental regulator-domain-containing protein [Limtongia smithiae]|uniref:interferon-related developmental regulator-domain-containing protein n=1 Tax=Limtongia smithiae TaxID=1125753 RepID=UPI0034CF0DB8